MDPLHLLQRHQRFVDLCKVPVLLRRHGPRLVVPLAAGQVHEAQRRSSAVQCQDADGLGDRRLGGKHVGVNMLRQPLKKRINYMSLHTFLGFPMSKSS